MAPLAVSAVRDEAKSILEGLGYTTTEISHAFKQLTSETVPDDVEIWVKHSLKVLAAAER